MSSQSRITLAEIAKRSGVSQATVSLVLRNKPGVGADTRNLVLDTAKELGHLSRNSTYYQANVTNIGLILKAESGIVPLENWFYSRVLAGVEAICRQWNLNLLYATLPVDQDSYPLEIPRLLNQGDAADALLFVGAFLTDTLIQIIERQSTPVVLVDAYSASHLFDAVVSDNLMGARRAVEYLIDYGHRHIGFVGCHSQAYPSIRERSQGYTAALEVHAIPDDYFAGCHLNNREETIRSTVDLLKSHPQITALFCANDEVALAAMEAAQSIGRSIPEDLSVIGFDDIKPAETATPPLTTMHVDKFGMGRLAMQLLMNRVEYPESNPATVVLYPKLVERNSVRRI